MIDRTNVVIMFAVQIASIVFTVVSVVWVTAVDNGVERWARFGHVCIAILMFATAVGALSGILHLLDARDKRRRTKQPSD
ncbi:hypothetical protein [Leifsonia sp. Leaf264]|uniref:hypothetical protein n=1 Tax=Leifsonia sp. Leaf264 TaxID=1736314 RepID=UPI0006F7608F|nr:hypothetical protein [Leifsonia sp. Leaf264]KQO98448.1 hypothetical protein ASF30_10325 [Leifsonia sp. Leaf264]